MDDFLAFGKPVAHTKKTRISYTMNLGRILIGAGTLLITIGGVVLLAERIPFLKKLGRLPGDIFIKGEHVTFYFPIVTSLLLSLLVSLLLHLFRR